MIRIHFEGRTYDLREAELGLTLAMSEADIKLRLARHLKVSPVRLKTYVLYRAAAGSLLIRPTTVYH